jgi:hypothetical protein
MAMKKHFNGDNEPELWALFDPHLSYREGVIVCDSPIRPPLNMAPGAAYSVAYSGGVADCHPMGDPREKARSGTVWGIRWWDSKPTTLAH